MTTTLEQLWKDLAMSELSNTSMVEEDELLESARRKVTNHINIALGRLYSKFILKTQDVLVEMHEHITMYHLLKRFAVFAGEESGEKYQYIKDLPGEPFKEDVVKILAVFNSGFNQLPLNDANLPGSVFTPQANLLQIPRPIAGQTVNVMYQAKPDLLSYQEISTEIPLPDLLMEPLKRYIAYRVYNFMNTQEAKATAQEHLAVFEGLCDEAVENDLLNMSVSTTSTKFDERGWV